MGTFATITTLEVNMVGVQFTTTGNVNTLAGNMITRAEHEIRKWLSKRYDMTADAFQTSTSTPPMVQEWAAMLGEGHMWHALSRGGAGDKSVARGDKLIKSVLDNLKEVAVYKLDVLDSTGAVLTDMSNTAFRVLSNTKDYTDTFDEDDSLNWDVDSDKLDDISNARD